MTFGQLDAENDIDCNSLCFKILLGVTIEYRRENIFKTAKPYIDRFPLQVTPHEDAAGWRALHIVSFTGYFERCISIWSLKKLNEETFRRRKKKRNDAYLKLPHFRRRSVVVVEPGVVRNGRSCATVGKIER